jgi:hypothetical protein
MPLEIKGKYIRQRIKPPSAFRPGSFRTQVVGRHRRVAGILKTTGRYATQTLLHPVAELRTAKCVHKKCSERELAKEFKARRHL